MGKIKHPLTSVGYPYGVIEKNILEVTNIAAHGNNKSQTLPILMCVHIRYPRLPLPCTKNRSDCSSCAQLHRNALFPTIICTKITVI